MKKIKTSKIFFIVLSLSVSCFIEEGKASCRDGYIDCYKQEPYTQENFLSRIEGLSCTSQPLWCQPNPNSKDPTLQCREKHPEDCKYYPYCIALPVCP